MSPSRGALVRLFCRLARGLQAGGALASVLAAAALPRKEREEALARRWSDLGADQAAEPAGLLAWEATFYLPRLRPVDRILLVGCGSGRDLVPLLERGHVVDGLDVARSAVEAGRRLLAGLGLQAALHLGSIEDATLDSRYDVVVFSWLCYGFIPGAPARVRALGNARRHLADGGRVLVSYARREGPASLASRLGGLACRLLGTDFTPEPGDLLVVSDLPDGFRLHHERSFTGEEVEREARAAGLAVAEHHRAGRGLLVLRVPASS
jgi:SAM-dependent methyltransferase